jgi:hypothetical protein
MNWKTILGFFILFGGLTAVSFIVDKHSEGIRTVPFYPFILIIPAVFAYLGLYLFNKGRQKKARK